MDFKKILFKTSTIDVEKALPDAIIFCNKEGKILWVNDKAAEIFETSKMHLLTSNIADFIENPMNLIMNSIVMAKPVITKFNGKELYFDMTSKEIEEGFVLDFRDTVNNNENIQEKATEAYKEINRDKNNFLIKLSNDFKSPLQSIVGFSQAMADGLGGNMSIQQEKYIKIINKNSTDLMYFITKLLELSQTEVDMRQPEHKTFDILNAFNSILRFNEQLYKEKDIKWTLTADENFKNTINSDEDMLKTIIQNLLEVIVKSIDMGEIKISLSVPDEEYLKTKNINNSNVILINISCNSLLLSENDLESMFDPYKIVDTSNRKNVLRAITLACVKNLVQTIKGYIWVESQILKSTSFNILIQDNNT